MTQLNLVCTASLSIMHVSALLSGEKTNFWSIIEDYDNEAPSTTGKVTMSMTEFRALLDPSLDCHFHYHDLHDSYDLIIYPSNSVAGKETSVLCIGFTIIASNVFIYSGETCVQEADPFDFCGHNFSKSDDHMIQVLIFDIL